MKNRLYLFGLSLLILILLAIVFKMNQWPGASIMLRLGLLLFCIVFLPLVYIKLRKSTDDRLLRNLYLAAFLTFLIDLIGILFKILHWPGASVLLYIGVLLPFVLFMPTFIYFHNKRKLKADLHFFGILFFLLYMAIISVFLTLGISKRVLDNDIRLANSIKQLNTELNAHLESNRSDPEIQIIDNLIDELEKTKQDLIRLTNNKNIILDSNQKNYVIQATAREKHLKFYFTNKNEDTHWKCFLKKYTSINESIRMNKNPIVQQQIRTIDSWINQDNFDYWNFISSDISNQLKIISDWQIRLQLIKLYKNKE